VTTAPRSSGLARCSACRSPDTRHSIASEAVADALEHRTRPLLRPCLDWSVRRYHLAGSVGAALTATMASRRWIGTREASRVVAVTAAGELGLRDLLGVDLPRLRPAA
jgi:hypothetical protein